MPVDKSEFESGKLHSGLEDEIISFLSSRKERAFTSEDIMGGLDYRTEFSTPEIIKISTFTIADFTALLYDLVKRGRIRMRVVRGRMHFTAGESVGQCPQCGLEVQPKKTWKMTGRPDKTGRSLQLHIGLFRCPRHGFFRSVLDKQKVTAPARTKGKKSRKVQPKTAKKQTRKATKKRGARRSRKGRVKKKAEVFPLF